MPKIPALITYVANTKATAANFNANFSAVRTYVNSYAAFIDETATITGTWTFNTAPVFGVTAQFANGANVTGDLAVSGSITFGSIAIPAASVTPGNFAAGAYNFPGAVTADSLVVDNGQLRANRTTSATTTGSVTVDFATFNHRRVTLTGNSTLTPSGGVAGGIYTLEVLQDATGSRTLAWGADVVWAGGATPTQTSTANRKDVYTFFYDGSKYLAGVFGQNYSSTG